MKNMSEISYSSLLLSSHEITSILEKTVYKILKKVNLRHLLVQRVIYKFHLNSWNTKYSQNVTCACKNVLSVNHILLECPVTTELFHKNGYDFNTYSNVRDILYNADFIIVICYC